MRRWLAALGVVAIMATESGATALAAKAPPGENITASPTQINPEVAPGATVTGAITIINDGTKEYDFKGYVTPYHVSGEAYDPTFNAVPGGPQDASRWVHLAGSGPWHSRPRDTTVVPYTITVPAGTGGGGYYATLFFETMHQAATATGVTSNQRVGIVAYIEVKGSVTERGRLESFTSRLIQPGPPLTATLRLSNQGNVHYPADITEHITDLFGQPKADLHVTRQVLPGTTRRIDLAWAQAPGFGLFRVGGVANMLGRTEILHPHYVLILSAKAFVATAMALCLLVILGVWWWLGRSRRQTRNG